MVPKDFFWLSTSPCGACEQSLIGRGTSSKEKSNEFTYIAFQLHVTTKLSFHLCIVNVASGHLDGMDGRMSLFPPFSPHLPSDLVNEYTFPQNVYWYMLEISLEWFAVILGSIECWGLGGMKRDHGGMKLVSSGLRCSVGSPLSSLCVWFLESSSAIITLGSLDFEPKIICLRLWGKTYLVGICNRQVEIKSLPILVLLLKLASSFIPWERGEEKGWQFLCIRTS